MRTTIKSAWHTPEPFTDTATKNLAEYSSCY